MDHILNAKWICYPKNVGAAVCEFKKTVKIEKKVVRATLQASAQGVYVAYVNGKRVGNDILTPGWTDFRFRVQYQTYDITDMLTENTVFTAELAQGWRMHKTKGWFERPMKGTNTAFIASVYIEYEDGTEDIIYTDNSWTTCLSATRYSDIYNGETYDADFNDDDYLPARVVTCAFSTEAEEIKVQKGIEYPTDILCKHEGEFVREKERFAPLSVFTTPNGETVIDFGQNLSGYVEFSIKGDKGHKASIRYFEELDKDGNVYVENLRAAKTTVTYYCDGERRTFKPKFTFFGYRYIHLINWPEEVKAENFVSIAIYSDMKRTGYFECSDKDVNRLFENVVWGQRSNFVDVPTDCPQRDERLGWSGDAQVFARTASLIYDTERFFRKWLHDLSLGQSNDGGVPHVIPNPDWIDNGAMGWADVAVICPWQVYQAYGNSWVLAEQFSSMRKWVDYMRNHSKGGLWLGGGHFADWLNLDGDTPTSKPYLQNAYFIYSTSLLIKTGKLLGLDMTEYEQCLKETQKAFRETFMKDGKITENTQTACAEALYFGFLSEEEAASVSKQLNELVEECGHLKTGFLGTPYLLHALSDNGYTKTAYDLLLRHEFPGWLYSVDNGATTIWEHWDSRNPDGTMWSAEMNSFNHYAYGSVAEWLIEKAAGITHDEEHPGFSHVIFKPVTDSRLDFVKASVDTRNGKVASEWKKEADGYKYTFTVPAGVTATVILDGKSTEIGEGTHTI